MKPEHESLDYWKAKARELERKAAKFEALYLTASSAVSAAERPLVQAHSILTLALMSPLDPAIARELGLNPRKEITAETAVDLAEELLNAARFFLAAVGYREAKR
jgi:hypothetical protein